MKQAITNLSKQQNSFLNKLIAHHNLDSRTSSKTQKYYRELRKIYSHLHCQNYQVEHLMKAAIILAQKSHTVFSLKGERLRGSVMCLNQMLKLNEPLNKLANILKIFATHSKAVDPQLREQLFVMVGQMNLGCCMYSKFERGIEYFKLQEVVDAKYGYTNAFKSFTWLFFLQARQQLNINQSAKSDYLLISILYLTIRYAFPYIRPKEIPMLSMANSHKNLVTSILNKLFQIFVIDDVSSFKSINGLVDDYFEGLISSERLKCTNFDCYDFLSPNLINLNYRKIDLQYRKHHDPNSIDYRLFLHSRLQTLTPRRFSQISQKKHPLDKKSFKQKSFASHKILTFQNEEQECKNQERLQQFVMPPFLQRLPANVKISPSNIKTPMIWAIHQSPSSPIQNFIYRQVRQGKGYLQQCSQQDYIVELIESILSEYCNDGCIVKDKAKLTFQYYMILRLKYCKTKCEQQDGLNAVLIYALLVMIFSIASTTVDGERVRSVLNSICHSIDSSAYSLWVINGVFTQLKPRLPTQLQLLVVIMDDLIINELLWKEESFIRELTLAYQQTSYNRNMTELLMTVIDRLQNNVIRLMTEFTALQNGQEIQQVIDKTVKYIIVKTPQLIQSHNLMQIVFCCVYLVFRSHQITIKFNDILTTFQHINRIHPNTYKRLINEVQVQVQEQGIMVCNIIEYYNKFFLPFIKQHRLSINQWNFSLVPAQRVSRGEQKFHRYHSFQMKQNISRRYAMQPYNDKQPKLKTQASPTQPNKEKERVRNETRMRSRPIDLMGYLNTQKTKSPNNIR